MAWICALAGCDRVGYARSYCEMHYRRILRTGRPGAPDSRASTCSALNCNKPVEAKRLCHGHYQRLRRTGVADDRPLRVSGRLCSVEGCDRPHKARGLCQAHYKRVLACGDPLPNVPIRRYEGKGTTKNGYRNVPVPAELRHLTGGRAWVGEHRLVMAQHLGRPLLPDEQVHHINGNRGDNRVGNLELWSTSHPSGRRVEDLLEFCQVMLDRYMPDSQRIGAVAAW